MASTIAALNIMVNANTGSAIGQLSLLDKKLKESLGVANATSTGMTAKLGPKMVAGAGLAAVGVAAVVAGKQLFDLGKDLDTAYDKIRVGTGATGKRLDKLKADFRSVASSVPDDFDTVGKSIAGLNTRLDLSGKPLRRMSRNMLNLSRITETDLEGNIKSVSRAFQDWDVPVKKQTRSLNGLFRLSQKGGGDVSELAENIQKFGSPLRNLGFDISEAAAMFATFEKAGVNTQTMVPGLKLALANLTAPTDKLKGSLDSLDVAIGNPKKGLQQVMDLLGDKSKLKATDKINLAMQVFGKRAGADMAEAVKQGRFNVDNMVKTFKHGSDTIGKTTRDTNDFGENMAIFGNKIKIAFAPLADVVFNAVGKLSAALAGLKINQYVHDVRHFMKTNEDFKDVLAAVKVGLKAFGVVAKFAFSILKDSLKGAWTYAKGVFQAMRGVIKLTSGVLTGDWKKAWEGVKDIFRGSTKVVLGVLRGMTAPARKIGGLIMKGLKSVFSGAWDTITGIFEGGANAVLGLVKDVINVLNKIPGVEISTDGLSVGGGSTPDMSNPGGGKGAGGHQRGAYITGGKPSGDSVPAMLERGEYVLNRNAVKKVGVDRLNDLNFKAASRFQTGGPVGLINGGDVWDAAKGAVSGAANLAMKGPGFFIDKLPDPNIPEPFTGVGPYVIDAAKAYIKKKVAELIPDLGGGADIQNLVPQVKRALAFAQTHGWSGSVSDGWRSYSEQAALYAAYKAGTGNLAAAPGTSNHEGGEAVDVTDTEGFAAAMQRLGAPDELFRYVPGEPWHFSVTGHQKGGLIGRIARMVKGGTVVKQAAPILARKGFDFKSIAGILGNAYGESNWDTEAMEPGTDNGGLFGFTAYEKSMDSLRSFAASHGMKWSDVKTQILFMLASGGMGTKGAMNALDSIPATTEYFMSDYERPGIPRLDVRTQGGFMAAKIMKGMSLGKSGLEGEAFGGSGKASYGSAIGEPNAKQVAQSHKRTLSKIKAKGLSYPFKDKLMGMEGIIGSLGEQLGIAEQNADAEWGPGGSELTDAEKADQVYLNKQILAKQQEESKWLNKAIAVLYARETAMSDQMWAAKPKGSETHWKFGALKKAVKDIRGNINGLGSVRETLVGITGSGGELFDTQMRLKNLGVASTVESASAAARDSELVSLMREQLSLANRNNAILSAQMPIYTQFMPKYHTGGVIPGAGEQPIMAMGGEGVFTRDQMAAIGGGSPTVVIEIAPGAGVDPAMIDARINGQLVKTVRRTRTGNAGAQKYNTAGLR